MGVPGRVRGFETFPLALATDKALAVDTEFAVIEKAGAESEIEFFKVTRTSPYGLVTAAPRVESESGAGKAAPQDDPTAAVGGDDSYGGVEAIAGAWRGVTAKILMFVKAGGAALRFFLAAIFPAKWLFNAW